MKYILITLSLTLIISCSSSKEKKVDVEKQDNAPQAEEIYNNSLDYLKDDKLAKAIENFEEIERLYPYSKWAIKAQVMAAYAKYKDEQYDDAIFALERFIKLHPGHADVAYAYYLRGLSFYEQISVVQKDQSYTLQAKSALRELIARFPNSEYAYDAKLKLDLVRDHLAGKELAIGRFYLKQGNHIAAINRFKNVVDNYQTTSHTPESLHRLVESYVALGVDKEAIKYAAVLGHNYVDSKWYNQSYNLLTKKGYEYDKKQKKFLGIKIPFIK